MINKEALLEVAEALQQMQTATDRVNTASQRLEAAKQAVELARSGIAEAKENASTAKTALDEIVSKHDDAGVPKAAILAAAGEINRVFADLNIHSPSAEEVAAEVELPKAVAEKLTERVADKFTALPGYDDAAEVVQLRTEDLRLWLDDVLSIISQATSKIAPAKEAETPTKRRRRSKAEMAAEQSAGSSETELLVGTAVETVVEPVAETVETADTPLEADAVVHSEPLSDAVSVVDEEISTAVLAAAEAPVSATVVTDAAAGAANELINSEIREEVFELIEANVSEDDISAILGNVCYAVFLKSQHDRVEHNLASYLGEFNIETMFAVSSAEYGAEIASELDLMLADREYVSHVISWFVKGVHMLEEGKAFPPFSVSAPEVALEDIASVFDQEEPEATSEEPPEMPAEYWNSVEADQDYISAADDDQMSVEYDADVEAEEVQSITSKDAISAEQEIETVQPEPTPASQPAPAAFKPPPFMLRPSFDRK